jgi:hypothetical protein
MGPYCRAGHSCRYPHARTDGDRPDDAPDERALALGAEPGLVVVRDEDVAEAGLLRHHGVFQQLAGPCSSDDRKYPTVAIVAVSFLIYTRPAVEGTTDVGVKGCYPLRPPGNPRKEFPTRAC